MKKILAFLLVALTVFAFASCSGNNDDAKVTVNSDGEYVVGICQLAPHPALDAATQGFKDALKEEFGDKVSFIEQNAQGDNNTCTTIITSLVNKNVDLIMANATAALQAAASGTKKIPVLGTSVTEYGVALGIADFSGTVGGNISGTSDLAPLSDQADMVKELYPDAKNIGLLYCSAEPNSDYQIKEIEKYLGDLGYTCKKYPFSDTNDVASVSAKAAQESDVIYVPTDNTVATCTGAILGAIGDKPIIAGESGICSGCGVATLSIDYYDLGFATGKMAVKILNSEKSVTDMPIEYAPEFEKLYNKSRCEDLGINISDLEAKGYKAIATQ